MEDKATIKVTKEVHKDLIRLKAEKEFKTLSELIKWMMENVK